MVHVGRLVVGEEANGSADDLEIMHVRFVRVLGVEHCVVEWSTRSNKTRGERQKHMRARGDLVSSSIRITERQMPDDM